MKFAGHISIMRLCCAVCAAVLIAACSTTRHVPQGEMLLDDVKIVVKDSSEVETADLYNFLRQTPNHKVLGFAKLQLGTYNLSGKDSTKWYNKWLRRMGQPPVIYSPELTSASQHQLRQALINKGYMDAQVEVDTVGRPDKKKIKVRYLLNPGAPHTISSITYEIPDTALAKIVMRDSADFTLKPGDLLDRTDLDTERALITQRLRNRGYYAFTKEYITFYADTAEGSKQVDLTLAVQPPRKLGSNVADTTARHSRYYINKVIFVTDDAGITTPAGYAPSSASDTVMYKGVEVIYGKDHYIKPSILVEKCFLVPGQMFRSFMVDRTYEQLAQLGIIKSINIQLVPQPEVDGKQWLDAYVYLSRNKKQGISFEVEGTNSEGDLGFGVGLTYQHRNLAHRSNLLTTKFRANYESLSGNLSGLINDRYTEFAGEMGITFPKFLFPFLSGRYKRRIKASTELALSFNYQERPEYTRIIAGAAWKYKWTARQGRERRTFDLLDINYVYLPESTIDFINQIAPTNPLLRYSYEDHFIMRMGYTYRRTNKRIASSSLRKEPFQTNVYSWRASGEVAGNLLYAISSLANQKRKNGVYEVFGIQYSQYAKAEVDYTIAHNFTPRHSLAFHAGFGIGVPYGNSQVLPFEKRFYAGGANGVRGWSVRTLGPGSYDARNSVTDFINQCGDIRLDLSLEYRMKLFWVFEGALFVDAGNIWTIRNYENQPGGVFKFRSFAKELAAAYGVGLRMDFTYFLLRLDLGFKAHNPARNQEPWPIIHPRWKRDTSLHFSVGYPF